MGLRDVMMKLLNLHSPNLDALMCFPEALSIKSPSPRLSAIIAVVLTGGGIVP